LITFLATPKKTVPRNVKVLPWIPQNDVLGHVNTRAFVTHVGHNGMFEAAYHRVPMVGAPLLYDQFDNARMMEAAGLGISIDIRSISADELTAAIERVIQETR
jgi:UDP:flavonoid glycosyltransferase YjiC (YdhE family)